MTVGASQGKRAARAGLWASLQNVAREGIGFLIFLLLARFFLGEKDFGIVALANSFVMFAQIIGQFGLGTALIRSRQITDRHKTACFWVTLGGATLLALLLIALSGHFAQWAQEPRLAPVLQVLSLGLPVTFAGAVHAALLQRSFGFKALAIRSLIAGIFGGLAAIATAMLGGGVWSLVALNLATAVVSTYLLWRAMPWRPTFDVPVAELKDLLPTGLRITGIGIVRYAGDSADRFIVGFSIGIADLGLLFVSQRIVKALQTVLTQSINAVALPVFSEIQDDIPRIRSAYLTAFKICLVVIVPLFIGLALVSRQIAEVILGAQWLELPLLLSILAIAAAFSAPLYFNQPLLIAIGRAQQALQIASVGSGIQILCVALGASFGLVGVAFGLLVRQIIMNGVWIWVLKREIDLAPQMILSVIRVPVVGIMVMTALLVLMPSFPEWSGGFTLSFRIFLGAFSYLSTLWLLDRSTLVQIYLTLGR
ncbi:lipopolysaccharide biosynthesis protein [Rhodobacteraceae bacterium KMM 6894]|nr:lipopolysaccharide biosynthesis protein [Rhodobacteraceae bacterium KMM 6894]